MPTKRGPSFPTRLEKLKKRFDAWRQTRQERSPIPESLWRSAVKLAEASSINRVSKALHINHAALKEKVLGMDAVSEEALSPHFVELSVPPTSPSECSIELEKPDGSKMRMHFNCVQGVDLTSLTHSFWTSSS